jgi:hypothetical protein
MANFLLRSDWRVEEAGTVKLPVESSIRLLLFAVGDEVERSDYVSATNARRVEDKKSLAQVQHDYAGVTCERADELGQRKDRSCAEPRSATSRIVSVHSGALRNYLRSSGAG